MRRLKEQGELLELRDDEGPGGDALPHEVGLYGWYWIQSRASVDPLCQNQTTQQKKQVRAEEEEEAKRTKGTKETKSNRKAAGSSSSGGGETSEEKKEKDMTASMDATVEATVVRVPS